VFLSQLMVSKALPWLMPPPAFMMVQDFRCSPQRRRGRGRGRGRGKALGCACLGPAARRRPGLHPSRPSPTLRHRPPHPQPGLCHHPAARAPRAARGARTHRRPRAERCAHARARAAARVGRRRVRCGARSLSAVCWARVCPVLAPLLLRWAALPLSWPRYCCAGPPAAALVLAPRMHHGRAENNPLQGRLPCGLRNLHPHSSLPHGRLLPPPPAEELEH
jgi:hypothetical protein